MTYVKNTIRETFLDLKDLSDFGCLSYSVVPIFHVIKELGRYIYISGYFMSRG